MAEYSLRMEDMREAKPPMFKVEEARVIDVPVRRKTYHDGPDHTIVYRVCFHGRNLKWPCRLCEFEVEKLEGER